MTTHLHRRYDTGGRLLRTFRRADGALLAEGYASCEGVLEYRRADGSVIRELVTREAVEDTARTMARAAVTLDHPPEFVTPDNVQKYGVGDVDGAAEVEELAQGGFARIKIAVRRRDGLDAIEAGTHELSAGYDVEIDPTPGEHPTFGRYDARQVRRTVNHVAIVPRGRAGSQVALRTDSSDACAALPTISAGAPRSDQLPKEGRMTPSVARLLALLGVDARVDSDDAALNLACEAVQKSKQDAEKEKADVEKEKADELEKLKAENDKLKADNDKLKADMEKERGDAQALRDAAARADLLPLAAALKVDGADKLDLPALRVAVAKAHMGEAMRADATDAYVDAVIDMARKDSGRTDAGREAGRNAWTPEPRREDGGDAALSTAALYRKQMDAAFEASKAGGAS